ncbi:AfsR/SARP family transcriptional regulator [Kibdelosporangium philippinense]|uniref:AfsR/SARP family transcriptional regulator n=1 Tax=Kibdelosporangium philippinense TaxID=211113 RepID=A0ABS8Z752_9PSEU|nr:AfsR/SARP family transcriptional regulator [Kibdelosporangium philippinense]MCE7003232.1 AfsR/SARP family transcriptional regulator [Kibdelosporangium philippinense]
MLAKDVQVNVLGKLEVAPLAAADPHVTITATKPRQVLVLLAVNAGAAVRTDQLIDELWPSGPPQTVRTIVQTYIYQLRKLFEGNFSSPEGRDLLTTAPDGYVLSVPRENIDLYRFQHLIEDGRAALRDKRFSCAAGMLRECLELWRGPVPADVTSGPRLRGLSVFLEEQRLEAVSLRIEADLAIDRHLEVVGELRSLVATYPLHEVFHLRLMQALHGSGRRGEALYVYRQLRSTLNKELGLEPSREVNRVHQEILVGH